MKTTDFKFKYVICKFCGWIHFQVSREYAKSEVKSFNEMFDKLSKEQQELYYGGRKSSVRNYEYCHLCGTCYHNFRNVTKKDKFPNGSTISPIITRKD